MAKTQSFDEIFTATITDRAARSGNEWVIPLPEVNQVIHLASEHLIAVLGVESFCILENVGLGVAGFTGYEFDFRGDWPNYVRRNNEAALRYIEENPLGRGFGYILTAVSEDEFKHLEPL